MKFIAWSSKSGSDAIWLTERLKKTSKNRIAGYVTNNPDSPLIDYAKKNNLKIFVLNKKPTVDEYISMLGELNQFDAHFLMGYLRIIPSEICSSLKMYNVHPGNIIDHPELKGFDPQERALELKHTSAGCVLHEVIAEVDSGEILFSDTVEIDEKETLDSLIGKLVNVARVLWICLIRELEGQHGKNKIRKLSQS